MNGQVYCDLHCHTTASDGDHSPTELVGLAVEKELGALGVCDHDTVGGIEEALAAAGELGLQLAPGVEISADYNPGTMHILGYFVDHTHPQLLSGLEEMRGGRDVRNQKIINKLNELGVEITMEEVLAVAGEDSVGRPHIASVIISCGYETERQAVFDKYLAKGAPAYFDRSRLGPEESIALIRGAGGIPVLAHPIQLILDGEKLDSTVGRLVEAGLEGIEVLYWSHSPDDTASYLALAKKYSLLITGGSDYHGPGRPETKLGVGYGDLRVPIELYERLKNYAGA